MKLIRKIWRFLRSFKNPLLRIKNFNFQNSTELADYQTQIFNDYSAGKLISNETIQKLENNLWIKAAHELAPGNLVIRQYCLIDLLKNSPDHVEQIFNLLNRLSYNGQIWAEGYSYYLYTLDILQPWVSAFKSFDTSITPWARKYGQTTLALRIVDIEEIVSKVNQGFLNTAYYRNGVLFPAPFGDVRDQPLNVQRKINCNTNSSVSIVTRQLLVVKPEMDNIQNSYVMYEIKGKPIGLNCHVPKNYSGIPVYKGIPTFKFYEGWNKKYESKEDELKDLLDIKRILSI